MRRKKKRRRSKDITEAKSPIPRRDTGGVGKGLITVLVLLSLINL